MQQQTTEHPNPNLPARGRLPLFLFFLPARESKHHTKDSGQIVAKNKKLCFETFFREIFSYQPRIQAAPLSTEPLAA